MIHREGLTRLSTENSDELVVKLPNLEFLLSEVSREIPGILSNAMLTRRSQLHCAAKFQLKMKTENLIKT